MNEYCFWLNDINVIDEFNITNIDINEFLKKVHSALPVSTVVYRVNII